MLIPFKSLSAVFVTASSKPMYICNRFHARRADSRKIKTFRDVCIWCPRAQASFNIGSLKLGLLKSTFHAENFLRRLSWSRVSTAISAQFTLEMCVAARNLEKFTKIFYFSDSKSFKVIDVDAPKNVHHPCLLWLSSMLMPICNWFHARRANSGKMRTFRGTLFMPSFEKHPLILKICHKTSVFVTAHMQWRFS